MRRGTHRSALAIAVLSLLGTAGTAQAAQIDVTTTTDEFGAGAGCALREAVESANTDAAFGGCATGAGADTVGIPAGNYLLTLIGGSGNESEDLDVDSDVTFTGAGAAATTIDANGALTGGPAFAIREGDTVAISGVTVRGGASSGAAGGIANSANLTITDSVITANSSAAGGGIYSDLGSLSLVRTTITGNTAEFGGGIASLVNTTITDSVIANNTATEPDGDAAGMFNEGNLTVTNTTVAGNTGVDEGGGIYSRGGSLSVIGSTISGNQSAIAGGIFIHPTTTVAGIANSTISGNVATTFAGGLGIRGGQTALNNVTLTANVADSDANGSGNGGGISVDPATGPHSLYNTLVSGNEDRSPAEKINDCAGGGLATVSHSLIGEPGTCVISSAISNLPAGTDPGLAPLAANGGLTMTHALAEDSPLIAAGNPGTPGSGLPACESTDQRAVARVDCEIGAWESQLPTPVDDEVRLVINGGKLTLARNGTTKVRIECPASEASPPCAGKLFLQTYRKVKAAAKKKKRKLTKPKPYSLGSGETAKLKLKLTRKARKLVRRVKAARRIRAKTTVSDAEGNTRKQAKAMRLKVKGG